jgi:hypothetical protein
MPMVRIKTRKMSGMKYLTTCIKTPKNHCHWLCNVLTNRMNSTPARDIKNVLVL